jgi:transposase-like protein
MGPGLYERSSERQGYATGYKPKTVKTRLGDTTFDVLQVREGGFYPAALEKGLRGAGRDVRPRGVDTQSESGD